MEGSSARLGGHTYCGDKKFLVYYVTSCDNTFRGLCDLMGWSFSYKVAMSLAAVVVTQQLQYVRWTCITTWSKNLVALWYGREFPVVYLHPAKIDYFGLSRDITRARGNMVMWLCWQNSIKVCNHPAKFCGNEDFGCGDMILVCHVSHITTWLYDHLTLWVKGSQGKFPCCQVLLP